MAIRFRGTLADFSQLEYGYCPPGSIQLEEGDTLEGVIGQALRQSLPLFLLMAALTLVRLVVGMNWAVPFSVGRTFLVMVLWMVLYVVLIVVHEWIHALFFPRRAVKDVWFYRLQAAMVYCNTPVTRNRFIVMSLAPAAILGIIPFIGWLFWGDRPGLEHDLRWHRRLLQRAQRHPPGASKCLRVQLRHPYLLDRRSTEEKVSGQE